MRLIDADELIDRLMNRPAEFFWHKDYVIAVIEMAETVETCGCGNGCGKEDKPDRKAKE